MAYRSSFLALLERHCPRALDFAERGAARGADTDTDTDGAAPRERDVFAVGIAAHAVLDALCRIQRERGATLDAEMQTSVATAVAESLVTQGRSFEGVAEPPMHPAHAAEGRDLALLAWAQLPASIEDRSEHGLAVDEDWHPVDYASPRAWWRAAVDLVGPVEIVDEDYGARGLCVTDYKSAWPTDDSELGTIQLRGQALVALAHAEALGVPDPQFLRRRVINLRTRQAFEVDTFLDETGLAEIEVWRQDIRLLVAAAEARNPDGQRPARPGVTCMGCPYITRCEAARVHLRGGILEHADPSTLATQLAVADAMRKELWGWAREATKEGSIAVDGGVIGFVEATKRKPIDDAPAQLALKWFEPVDAVRWLAENERTVGLLRALGLGVGSIESVAKALHPANRSKANKALREEMAEALTTPTKHAEFGIHKEK